MRVWFLIFCLQDSTGHHIRADSAVHAAHTLHAELALLQAPWRREGSTSGYSGPVLEEALLSELADEETGSE